MSGPWLRVVNGWYSLCDFLGGLSIVTRLQYLYVTYNGYNIKKKTWDTKYIPFWTFRIGNEEQPDIKGPTVDF